MNVANDDLHQPKRDPHPDVDLDLHLSHCMAVRPLYYEDGIKDSLIKAIDNATFQYAINAIDINTIDIICQYLPKYNYFLETPILFEYGNTSNQNRCCMCKLCLSHRGCFYRYFSLIENIGDGHVAFRIRIHLGSKSSLKVGLLICCVLFGPFIFLLAILMISIVLALGPSMFEMIVTSPMFIVATTFFLIGSVWICKYCFCRGSKEHILLVDVRRHILYKVTRKCCNLSYRKNFMSDMEQFNINKRSVSYTYTHITTQIRSRNDYVVYVFDDKKWFKGQYTDGDMRQIDSFGSEFDKFCSYYERKKNQWEFDNITDLMINVTMEP